MRTRYWWLASVLTATMLVVGTVVIDQAEGQGRGGGDKNFQGGKKGFKGKGGTLGTSDALRQLEVTRTHWSVENGLHWVLDVAFQEDQSRLRRDYAAENMAVLRPLALSLLRQESTCTNGIKVKRLKAALDEHYLTRVLLA